MNQKEKVYGLILDLSKRVAKQRIGALLVVAPKNSLKNKYKALYPQILDKHHITEKGIATVLDKISHLDGAILFSDKGEVLAYGAMIKDIKTIPGFGTRHAAAAGITKSVKNSTAFLISEKDDWVKVFQKGRIVMEIDSSDKPRNLQNKIVSFLTDNDTALVTTAGVSAAILGFAPVLIVSGTYLAVKTAGGLIRKSFKTKRAKQK